MSGAVREAGDIGEPRSLGDIVRVADQVDVAFGALPLVEAISSFSFITHFASITAGVIDLRDVIFFFSLIGLFLYANMLVVDLRKSG